MERGWRRLTPFNFVKSGKSPGSGESEFKSLRSKIRLEAIRFLAIIPSFNSSAVMVNRLIHIILIVAIVSCPIRCHAGLCGSCCGESVESQVNDAGCCCQSKSQPESTPTPTPENPCKTCNCICAGATLPNPADVELAVELHWICLPSHFDSLVSQDDQQFQIRCHRRAPDLPSSNEGRRIRCWCNSLLI